MFKLNGHTMKKFFGTISLSLFSLIALQAQQPLLSLEEAIEQALQNNSNLE